MEIINHPVISIEEIVRPTIVEVDLSAIKFNYKSIKEKVGNTKVMAILKANAYGHGLLRIAQLFEDLDVDFLGVAVVEEGILLRQNGIKKPILVLGGIWGNQIPLFLKYDLSITASSADKLKNIDEIAGTSGLVAKVHLKIDTGMERIGVHYYNSEKFIETAVQCKNIKIEGIYSHFANSDINDKDYTGLQISRFMESVQHLDKYDIDPPLKHLANSGGILNFPESYLDMVRPGIILFGVPPATKVEPTIMLKPALTWKSKVVYFKVIKPGHPVGYGSTWVSDRNIRSVTIPVGYGDGYFRSMSHKAKVIINDRLYPTIGTISMDQFVVNIENDSAFNGDEVILIGKSENNFLTCQNLAEWAGTIPYEILTNINTRVPRVYINL